MSIPGEISSEILGWHDLSADEVHHIAHLEHEARTMVTAYLGRITTGWEETQILELAGNAQKVRDNYEQHAQSWLENIAAFRGLNVNPQAEVQMPTEETLVIDGSMLRRRRVESGLSQRQLAQAIDISQSALSRAESGKSLHPSAYAKVRNYLASFGE